MASLNDEVTNNVENSQQAMNTQTNMDKLAKCTIDLRDVRIDFSEDLSALPAFFVIILSYNQKNYDVW
jgi:virulence-associated protein VapD